MAWQSHMGSSSPSQGRPALSVTKCHREHDLQRRIRVPEPASTRYDSNQAMQQYNGGEFSWKQSKLPNEDAALPWEAIHPPLGQKGNTGCRFAWSISAVCGPESVNRSPGFGRSAAAFAAGWVLIGGNQGLPCGVFDNRKTAT